MSGRSDKTETKFNVRVLLTHAFPKYATPEKFYQRKSACLKIDRVFPIVIRHLSMQGIKWNKQASNAFLPILTEISAPLNFVLKSDTKMSF